jgi:beta-N-acetylhexosaminidase/D-alanyl-D-alanine dipeptidase
MDIRYATPDNFTGRAVYPVARCLLRRPVAQSLARVQKALEARGLGLQVWDCYRPFTAQERLWEIVPDERYVARPVRSADGEPVDGSKHNRGAAVDLTLIDARGNELAMPTAYDDFSERAHRASALWSEPARKNAELLETHMAAEGFLPLPTEWWHFDGPNWERFPLADLPLWP